MNVSVEKTGVLGRRLKSSCHWTKWKHGCQAYAAAWKNGAYDGFRAGRVPEKVLRKRYGESVFQQIASSVIETGYQQALAEHRLVPVGEPDFGDTRVLPGQDLHFVVDIEVYPEFELAPLDGEKIEKPVVEITEDDVARMIDRSRCTMRNGNRCSVVRSRETGCGCISLSRSRSQRG